MKNEILLKNYELIQML